jgi:hypothetical protein
MIIEAGAYPSPLGYRGFPKSICTSVNECVCHGIPDSTQLQVMDNEICLSSSLFSVVPTYHGLTKSSAAEWGYYKH